MQYIPGSLGHNSTAEELQVWSILTPALTLDEGTLGYRFPSAGVIGKEEIPSFILQIQGHGILIIDVISENIDSSTDDTEELWLTTSGDTIQSRDVVIDNFYRQVENRLKGEPTLYNRRKDELNIAIEKVLVFSNTPADAIKKLNLINKHIKKTEILNYIKIFISQYTNTKHISEIAQSVMEGTKVLAKRRKKPADPKSELIGDLIEKSLDNTFTLDEEQRKVSMQLPQGPQRIRGLAGTGKTVILALKAALTHKEDEKLRILSVFNTQSMYNQIENLIATYYTNETRSTPNWSNLEVMHAWGGKYKVGFYWSVCKKFNFVPFAFNDVKSRPEPMDYIFQDLLRKLETINPEPYYDMVLIDEAQDFPQPFFEVIYLLTKAPKRIVWAYDEFQSLNDLRIKEPRELFGVNKKGEANIPNSDLEGVYLGGIEKDFILSNCYRNPRITLMTAHGLGLGIYRKEGIVDILPDSQSWRAIGYNVLQPKKEHFQEGDKIEIERPEKYSRNILETMLKEQGIDDKQMLEFNVYPNWNTEHDAVVEKIHSLITTQNIRPEQVIVISLATSGTSEIFNSIRQKLDFLNIKCITPGFIENSDMFQEEGFVTLVTPYRAKGNEANIVFVIDAQYAITNKSFRSRNAVFVSVTRSRGFCYISGNGSRMKELSDEFSRIRKDYPKFKFKFPSEEELSRRRVILSKADTEVEKAQRQIDELITKNPELLIEYLKGNKDLIDKITGARDDAS